MPTNLTDLTIEDALSGLQKKQFSCTEFVDQLIGQAEAQADLNGLVSSDWEVLRAKARAFDNGTGTGGRLAGIPLALKDNINTVELTSAAGTTVLRRFRPQENAVVAQALFDEGALLGGKTNMHELAFGVTTNNGATGATRNPWNRSCIPGGSSGGTGSVVAARIMPGGLGTDTGTSVRLPAALCGIFGFRPSMGRYSQKGIVPCSLTRDTAGPMTRTARDAVLLDAVITGSRTLPDPVDLKGVRLGVPRRHFYENLDSDVASTAEGFLQKLQDAGAVLVDCEVKDAGAISNSLFAITIYEFFHNIAAFLKQQGYDISLEEFCEGIGSPDVKGVFASQLGDGAIPEVDYRQALDVERPKLLASYRSCFTDNAIEALVFPVSPVPARPIGDDETIELNGNRVSTIFTYIQNTDPSSNAGNCGASLPAGLTSTGLPVGIEIDGLPGMDARILGIAQSIEELVGVLPRPAGL